MQSTEIDEVKRLLEMEHHIFNQKMIACPEVIPHLQREQIFIYEQMMLWFKIPFKFDLSEWFLDRFPGSVIRKVCSVKLGLAEKVKKEAIAQQASLNRFHVYLSGISCHSDETVRFFEDHKEQVAMLEETVEKWEYEGMERLRLRSEILRAVTSYEPFDISVVYHPATRLKILVNDEWFDGTLETRSENILALVTNVISKNLSVAQTWKQIRRTIKQSMLQVRIYGSNVTEQVPLWRTLAEFPQPGGYKFVTQPKKSIPVRNSAKFVLPVRISRPPVTSNLPKLKAKPTGTSSQSQGEWREEINRDIEMCEFYDNLPPIQQMAFKKMMHRLSEPMPAPILQSHPPCSEDELSRPRSPLMIPARLLRSYQKKKQQTNIVSGVDRPQSDVVSESFDISEPGPSTSEPLFRSEIKEEVVAENEITRNSNGEGASYTVQTVSSRLLPHYDPTQTMLKKSQGINNYLNKISVPSRIETSPLEDVKPLVPPHRIKAPVVQEKSGFTFKRVKFDKEDLQRPYQTVRTDLMDDEKPPTIDSIPTKFTRSAGIVEQSNTLPESLFSDFKNYKSHTIKAPKNVRICRSPDGDSLLPLLDDSYALNFPDEALAHNPDEVAPSNESTTVESSEDSLNGSTAALDFSINLLVDKEESDQGLDALADVLRGWWNSKRGIFYFLDREYDNVEHLDDKMHQ